MLHNLLSCLVGLPIACFRQPRPLYLFFGCCKVSKLWRTNMGHQDASEERNKDIIYHLIPRRVYCRIFFYSVLVKSLVSWTTTITGYMQNSLDEKVLDMFLRMNLQGKQVHGYAIKAKLENDEYVKNGLIDLYVKCNSLVDAILVCDVLDAMNTVWYNAMIEGYAMQEDFSEGFILLKKMRLESLHPSLLTSVSRLAESTESFVVELGKQVHNLVIKVGISLGLYAGSVLLDVYSKCSGVDDAKGVFEEMKDRDLLVGNTMIFGNVQVGQGVEAVKLFYQLCIARLKPTDFTFIPLIATSRNATDKALIFSGLHLLLKK
ncbi:hypothetical protein J5N97_024148 [Dioscorea zingiberensis]|uniref:Pentatricopeptide repeat-containing protein n=1 Tax=Dioscorea zingiberensis TaxID=325984 RepID=A0A9D5H8I1_9LILI|nr:hypothetical protein J5N97_024148 [Dioscorea zingiberensis]